MGKKGKHRKTEENIEKQKTQESRGKPREKGETW